MNYILSNLSFSIACILLSLFNQSNSIFDGDQSNQIHDLIRSIERNDFDAFKALINQPDIKEEDVKQILRTKKLNSLFFEVCLDKLDIKDNYLRDVLGNLYENYKLFDLIKQRMSIKDLNKILVNAITDQNFTLVYMLIKAGLNIQFSYKLDKSFNDNKEQSLFDISIKHAKENIFKLILRKMDIYDDNRNASEDLQMASEYNKIGNFLLLLDHWSDNYYTENFFNFITIEDTEKIFNALRSVQKMPMKIATKLFKVAAMYNNKNVIDLLIETFKEKNSSLFYLSYLFKIAIEQSNQYAIKKLLTKTKGIISEENKEYSLRLAFHYHNKDVIDLLIKEWMKNLHFKKNLFKIAIKANNKRTTEKLINEIKIAKKDQAYCLGLAFEDHNNEEVLDLLINAWVKSIDHTKNFLKIVIEKNNKHAIEKLLSKIKGKMSNKDIIDVLEIAIEHSDRENFDLLLKKLGCKSYYKKVIFLRAIIYGNLEKINEYINQGNNLNFTDFFQKTPLDIALKEHKKCNMNTLSCRIVDLLINKGGKLKDTDELFLRDLFGRYVESKKIFMLKSLIRTKSNFKEILKKPNKHDELIMDQAVKSMNFHIIKFLLNYIKIECQDNRILWMCQSAIKKNHLSILMLLFSKAKIKNQDFWKLSASAIKREANKNITSLLFSKLNIQDEKFCISEALGSFALMENPIKYKSSIMYLLQNGMNLLYKESYSARIFFISCLKNGTKLDLNLMKLLLERGLNINFIESKCDKHNSHIALNSRFINLLTNANDKCNKIYTPIQLIFLDKYYKGEEKAAMLEFIFNRVKGKIFGLKKALMLAISDENREAIKLILKRIDLKNEYKKTLLFINAINMRSKKVNELLHKKCEECGKWKRCEKCNKRDGQYCIVDRANIKCKLCEAYEEHQTYEKKLKQDPWKFFIKFLNAEKEELDKIYFLISENFIDINSTSPYVEKIMELAIKERCLFILKLLIDKEILGRDNGYKFFKTALKSYTVKRPDARFFTEKETMIIKTLLQFNPKKIAYKSDYIKYLLQVSIEKDDIKMFRMIFDGSPETYLNMKLPFDLEICYKPSLVQYIMQFNSVKIYNYFYKNAKKHLDPWSSFNWKSVVKYSPHILEYLFRNSFKFHNMITNHVSDKLSDWFSDIKKHPWDYSISFRINPFKNFYLKYFKSESNNSIYTFFEGLVYQEQAEMLAIRLAIALLEGSDGPKFLEKSRLKLEAKIARLRMDNFQNQSKKIEKTNYNFVLADLVFQFLFNIKLLPYKKGLFRQI